MSEELSPIARALLGGECDCEPRCQDREVSCTICGEKTVCLAFIWHAVRMWNRQEAKDAEVANEGRGRRAEFIKPSDMGIACEGECTARLYATRHYEVQQEHAQTQALWQMLLVGKYTAESLAWLRRHGYAKQVARILAEEGNKSHG